jgi:hypothetical protein
MNRRGFISALLGAPVAAPVVRRPSASLLLPNYAAIGLSFHRNCFVLEWPPIGRKIGETIIVRRPERFQGGALRL